MSSIKNSKRFSHLVKELCRSLYKKKLGEITTTASIDVYNTPKAFKNTGLSKKKKKNIEKQTGYEFVDEGVSKEDMETIKKQIRREVSDILRDIWIKRTSWGGK